MKKLILGLVVLLLLGGGGAGAYFFFFAQKAEASVGAEDEHAAEQAKADHAKEKGSDGHGGGGMEYVELAPLVLPIIDGNGITQTLNLVVVLEAESLKNKTTIEENEPRLNDAYIRELYGTLSKQIALEGGVLKVQVIKDRLRQVSDRVVGEDVVHDVLLQVVQQRPM
ncbi:MAG: flagellar basal body-associated FliL family protein [Alphaproteobacteria bacterium]|nr:flagellar basal body-associated FliL family protein [Alphaproteobacteria bacterium]